MSDLDDLIHRLALVLAKHQRIDPPSAHCTCDPDGEEVVRLGELFSKHLVEVVLEAGWVPPERLAEANRRIEQCQETRRHTVERLVDRYHRATDARDSLAAVVDRVRTLCDELEQAETADQRDHHADDLRAALDGQEPNT